VQIPNASIIEGESSTIEVMGKIGTKNILLCVHGGIFFCHNFSIIDELVNELLQKF